MGLATPCDMVASSQGSRPCHVTSLAHLHAESAARPFAPCSIHRRLGDRAAGRDLEGIPNVAVEVGEASRALSGEP